MYASNAWWGFSNANDRQKIFAFIRRCIRTGFCSPDLADFHDLYISSDEKLFNEILTCPNHILRTLLPPPTAQNYSLRNRPNNRQLPDRISRITDCNFTVRMLYRNTYWLLYILDLRFVLFLCTTAVWQFAINEYVMLCYVMLSSLHSFYGMRSRSCFCIECVCFLFSFLWAKCKRQFSVPFLSCSCSRVDHVCVFLFSWFEQINDDDDDDDSPHI